MKYTNIPSTGLIYALRHSSHNPRTAIADLIDNSIDADATHIKLDVRKIDDVSQLLLGDNGKGMDEPTLAKALTMGDHSSSDGSSLGKFGLGLKTSATTLGERFIIFTKCEGGKLLKCIYDPAVFARTKKWEIEIDETTDTDEEKLFNQYTNDDSVGTVILVDDLSRNWAISSIYGAMNAMKPFISESFFLFLPPKSGSTGKVQIFIQNEEVFGIDPMERQLNTTECLYDSQLSTPKGSFSLKVFKIHEADKHNCNLTPNPSNQGFYIFRNNREIMAAETNLFSSIWGQKHPTGNYLRVEIKYSSDMDEIFQVNHDKCGIKHIDQAIYDKIYNEIKTIIFQARKQQGIRLSNNVAKNEVVQKALDGVQNNIIEKKNLLDIPNDRKIRRNKTGNKKGTVKPQGTPTKRNGETPSVKTPIGAFKIIMRDDGAAGPVFDTEVVQHGFNLYWNIAHPFVRKYVTMDDSGNVDQIQSLTLMLFSTASYLQQLVDEKDEEGWVLRDNFIESMSKNLRALAS